jgi:hypothetical protein
MRYEFSDYEWPAITDAAEQARGVPRVNDRRTLNGMLQPVSVSCAQLDRTVLQQDQAMSACRDTL